MNICNLEKLTINAHEDNHETYYYYLNARIRKKTRKNETNENITFFFIFFITSHTQINNESWLMINLMHLNIFQIDKLLDIKYTNVYTNPYDFVLISFFKKLIYYILFIWYKTRKCKLFTPKLIILNVHFNTDVLFWSLL